MTDQDRGSAHTHLKQMSPFKNHLAINLMCANPPVIVDLRATNDSETLSLGFLLAFPQRKTGTNLDVSGVLPINRGGRPEDEITFLEYQKAVIGNGIIEMQVLSGEKVVCEVVIPVNVDIGRTFDAIDKRIAALRDL